MEKIIQDMGVYHRVSVVCLVLALCFLSAAVVAAAKFQIGSVLGCLTGHRLARESRRLRKKLRLWAFVILCCGCLWGLEAPCGAWAQAAETAGEEEGEEKEPLSPEWMTQPAAKTAEADGRSLPLYRGGPGEGVELSFVTDGCRDRKEVQLCVVDEKTGEQVLALSGEQQEICWVREGEREKAVFRFEGQEGEESVYHAEARYRDDSGMSSAEEAFVSPSFIVDGAPPEWSVIYTDAVRTVENGTDLEQGRQPVPGSISYYSAKIEVRISIRESWGELRRENGVFGGLEGFRLFIKKNGEEGETEDITDRICWQEPQGDLYAGSFVLEEEGRYVVQASFSDKAGNAMKAAEEGQSGGTVSEEGVYESPLLVLDRTPPVLRAAYTGEPVCTEEGIRYFGEGTELLLTLEDENLRAAELLQALTGMEAKNMEGESMKEETAAWSFLALLRPEQQYSGVWTIRIPLSTDARYTIPLSFSDLAGNEAVWAKGEETKGKVGDWTEQAVVDSTPPRYGEPEVSEGRFIPYAPAGWYFSQTGISVTLPVQDEISGLRRIRLTLRDEEGNETEKTENFPAAFLGNVSVEIPWKEEGFRGSIEAEAYDWLGNSIQIRRNCAAESEQVHAKAGKAEIVIRTEPSRIVNGTEYYNKDVELSLFVEDSFSGLERLSWSAGTESGSRDYAGEAQKASQAGSPAEIAWEFSRDVTIKARENNENGVRIRAEYTDNSGHAGYAERFCSIDVTPPEITVEYDLNDPVNGKYYNRARTATVTIQERNFAPEDVEFVIEGTDGAKPLRSGWSTFGSGDETTHVCRLVFEEDADYTFTLNFQDLAGNRADYHRTDAFTIDKTEPELTVTWNGVPGENERYFAGRRTAVLEITERCFDPDEIEVSVLASDGVEQIPQIHGWTHSGELHRAGLSFAEDGEYTVMISGTDMAGNALKEYGPENFVIDTTGPDLEITGVEDGSANKGEVCPVIRCRDEHYDPAGTEIVLESGRGGESAVQAGLQQKEDGFLLRMEDMPYERERDDLYTLKATVRDLAGNRTEKSIAFSVNRFGSVYELGEAAEELAGENGSYYTRQVPDLIVTETNVDTLEFMEITCNLNGTLRTLTRDEDYRVTEKQSAGGWKQYTYVVKGETFWEEGAYLLTICSEDRASNLSDTNAKGKKLEFAVDRTAPTVLVSGVEDQGRYRRGTLEILLDIRDNLYLKKILVELDGEQTRYAASDLEEGRLRIPVKGKNRWQQLTVTAEDAAGNRNRTGTIRFLVTPSLAVQLLLGRTLWCAGAAVFLGTCLLWRAARRRRKKEGNFTKKPVDREKRV